MLESQTRQPQRGRNKDGLHSEGTARGSTDVALRPPKRTGIDTATCDSALTLQARSSQLASSLPGHAAEPGDATAKASSSVAYLLYALSWCKHTTILCE
jgi:hypothetical protein